MTRPSLEVIFEPVQAVGLVLAYSALDRVFAPKTLSAQLLLVTAPSCLMLLTPFCYATWLVCLLAWWWIRISIKRPGDQSSEWREEFRSVLYVLTGLCVLGVDFEAFPESYSKSQVFGFTLMDLGVGGFVVSASLGAAAAAAPKKKATRVYLTLFLLSIARPLTHSALDYDDADHFEYGSKWWNFYTTLFCVFLITDFVVKLNSRKKFLLGVVVAVLHDAIVLGVCRAKLRILLPEGALSVPGFVALYLIAPYAIEHKSWSLFQLALAWVGCLSQAHRASRRLCDSTYVAFVTLTVITHRFVYSGTTTSDPLTRLLRKSGGLVFFVSANLSTGAINLLDLPRKAKASPYHALCLLALHLTISVGATATVRELMSKVR